MTRIVEHSLTWWRATATALGSGSCIAEYHQLGSEAKDRQERWRSFLLGEDPREQAVRRGDWVIGDEAFRLQVSQARGRPMPRARGRPRKSSKPGQVQFSP